MARWDGDKVTLDWTAGAPFVEIKVWDGRGEPAQVVRMHVDAAREMHTVLGIAIRESAPQGGTDG